MNWNVDEMSEQSKEQCTDKETIETQIPQDFEYVVRDFEILTVILRMFVRSWGAFKRANMHKIQIVQKNTRIQNIENRNSTGSDI
jgi:hypothetical protein